MNWKQFEPWDEVAKEKNTEKSQLSGKTSELVGF